LLLDRELVGAHGLEVLGRVEDIEVGLGGTQDEILASLHEVSFGLGDQELRLVVVDPVLPAEQWLAKRQRVAIAVELDRGVDAGGPDCQIVVVPCRIAGQRQGRQQSGAPLGQLLAPGFQVGRAAA
jgi:hypothetical protein